MIKALIFDLDGTLADTIDDIGWAVNRMLAARGFPTLERADHLANINNGAFQLIRRSVPEQYREDEEFVRNCLKEYEAEYSEHHAVDTVAYSGTEQALSELAENGYLLAVLSNKQDKYVKSIVPWLYPRIPFAAVMGQTHLPTKPDPTAPLLIAQNIGVLPHEIAFIGDSQVDIRTAINAGMYPVGVSWGYRDASQLSDEGAGLIIDRPQDMSSIPDMIDRKQDRK